jgi:hypothetical protein
MNGQDFKYLGISPNYKYVYLYQDSKGNICYRGQVGRTSAKTVSTEREAAINADRQLIEKGREPVNILVRK